MHRKPVIALTLAFMAAMTVAAVLPAQAVGQSQPSGNRSTRESTTEREGEPGARTIRQQAGMAMVLAAQGEVRTACVGMDAVLEDPRAEALPAKERAELLVFAAYVYSQCDRMDDAVKHAQASIALDRTPAAVMMTAMYAEQAGQPDVSSEALVAFVREWPKDAGRQTIQLAWSNFRAWSDAPARQRTFLQALFDARFNPTDGDASDLWFQLARLHLDAGDVAAAKAVAAEVKGLRNASRMRIDRRFDPVLADAPQLGDYKAQAARLLETLRAKQKAVPRAMPLRVAVAEEMVLLGDYPAALGFIDETLADVRGADEDAWQSPEYAAFLLRARASANLRQGKSQQAIEDFEMASMFVPPGGVDIPRLMLADQLCDLGRPKDAEEAAKVDTRNVPWLTQVRQLVRACAAAGVGDTTRARALADGLREAAKADDQALVVNAYLYAGDVDAAAPIFIAALDHPGERNDILMWAQNDPRLEPMPGLVAYRKAFDAMIARPDVQAALQKYGRVLEWDVYLGLE